MAKGKTKAAPSDPLDKLVQGDPKDVIALMLWKERHANPEMAMQITARDIAGYQACTAYLEVEPRVMIIRPQGRPATPEIPATATRSAIPAQEADPPRPYIVVQLVDQKGDGFKPIENNEADYDAAQLAARIRRIREEGPQLASQVIANAQAGDFSSSMVIEVAEALKLLCRP